MILKMSLKTWNTKILLGEDLNQAFKSLLFACISLAPVHDEYFGANFVAGTGTSFLPFSTKNYTENIFCIYNIFGIYCTYMHI